MTLQGGDVLGATPLGPEELAGLKPGWVVTRSDLNQAEQANILKGLTWASRARPAQLLSRAFTANLHRRMFGDVWAWAGTWRRRETLPGVAPETILPELETLFGDINYWVQHEIFTVDEIAVRLHHRMVFIHPFPNGNGRHTRQMADLLIKRCGGLAFSWGRHDLGPPGEIRNAYISALRRADAHDIAPLLAFARS